MADLVLLPLMTDLVLLPLMADLVLLPSMADLVLLSCSWLCGVASFSPVWLAEGLSFTWETPLMDWLRI